MLRITVGGSLLVALVMSGVGACSSKSDEGVGKGGTGSGGTSNGAAGTSIVGRSGSTGTGTSGTTGTGGAAADCANAPVKCVDAKTASTCNPLTGMDETIDCTDTADLGIISKGCTMDAMGDHCTIDGFADQPCADGVAPFAVCGNYTEDDAFDIYEACFTNNNGAHDVIPCFAGFVDDAAQTVDCAAAEAKCFGETGVGGDTGAGGAGPGPDAGGGAGGAP